MVKKTKYVSSYIPLDLHKIHACNPNLAWTPRIDLHKIHACNRNPTRTPRGSLRVTLVTSPRGSLRVTLVTFRGNCINRRHQTGSPASGCPIQSPKLTLVLHEYPKIGVSARGRLRADSLGG